MSERVSYAADPAALAGFPVDLASAGLVLGRDSEGRLVPVRMLRPEPTRVALVAGWSATRLLAFRALGLGARVVVRVAVDQRWADFGAWATGLGDRVVAAPPGMEVPVTGGAAQPTLVIDDPSGAAVGRPPGPWETRLTVVHQVQQGTAGLLSAADLVLLQRLTPAEAQLVTATLRLPARTAELLPAMPEDMLAVIGGGADRYVWLCPTPTEQQNLGLTLRQ